MRALPPARLSIPAAAPQAFPPRCTLLLTATSPPTTRGTPRRALLRSAAALAPLLLSTLLPLPPPAWAFENRLPPDEVELKYKSPRTAGPKPTDLGPQPNGGLKPCVDGKPHCFSTSRETFEDEELFNADYGQTAEWLVKPFTYTKTLADALEDVKPFTYTKTLADALEDVKAAVKDYPPGQSGIDGGGFKTVAEKVVGDKQAYLYVQFESRRRGYIDDVEFLLADGTMQLRTSSRLGYLDLGVNAKRFNWLARRFGALNGWSASPILQKGHEEYFSLNQITDADVDGSKGTPVTKSEKIKL